MKCQCKTPLVCVGVTEIWNERLKEMVLVPGLWVCPKCSRYGYEKSKQVVTDLTAWAESA